jgi:pilus assembly protein Flp/PilA
MATFVNGIMGPEMSRVWAQLLADESGQDLIEYGLIVAFIALGSVATMKGLASSLGTFFGSLGTTLTSSV